jgi:ADP-ribosyl-[dinitrogen reductase] hydrolase
VLKAVNLGHDSDTTGSVTGALAGIFYGNETIKNEFREPIVRYKEIENLAERFYNSIEK